MRFLAQNPTPQHRRARYALIGFVALGAALRFATLDVQSFDHDESVTAGRVLQPSLADTLGTLPESERTPPLYYLTAWAWTRLFGTGEVGLRSLSALAGVLALVAVFLMARRFVSERAALAATLLTAVNPLLVWNAQDARAYSLGLLLVAAALWATARLDARPTAARAAAWATCASLAVASHYFTAFVVVPAGIWLLKRRPRSRTTWVAVSAVAAALIALAPLAWEQAESKGGTADFGQGGIMRRLLVTGAQFTVGENPPVESPFPVDLLFRATGVAVAGLAVVALLLAVRSPDRLQRRGAALGVALAAAGVGLPVAAALVGLDFYNGRNALFALVPLIMAVGAGITAARRGSNLLGATIVALQLSVVVVVNFVPGLQRPDWRGLSERIDPIRPAEAVVTPRTGDDPLRFYLGAESGCKGGSAISRLSIVSFDPYEDGVPALVADPPRGFRLTDDFRHDSLRVRVLEADRPEHMSRHAIREAVAGSTAVLGPAGQEC